MVLWHIQALQGWSFTKINRNLLIGCYCFPYYCSSAWEIYSLIRTPVKCKMPCREEKGTDPRVSGDQPKNT